MKSIVRVVSLVAVWCVLTGVVQAADGILLVQKTAIAGGESRTNQIQIEKTRMRAESTGLGGEKQVVVFDGTKQVMTQINDQKKTYTEITKADLDAISGQMAGMMAQMEQQLKSLPPEQRAQAEAMMKGRGMGGAAAPAKVQYKKVGTATVGKWTCDQYEGYAGGQKTSEVCTVDPKTLGFSAADFEVARELAAFFDEAASARRRAGVHPRHRRGPGVERHPGPERRHRGRPPDHDRSDRSRPPDVRRRDLPGSGRLSETGLHGRGRGRQ